MLVRVRIQLLTYVIVRVRNFKEKKMGVTWVYQRSLFNIKLP